VTTIMITNSVEEALLLSDRIVPILPGPPATLGAPIAVDLPRGRTVAQLAHDEQASHVRTHVVATLTAALGSRVRRATTTPEQTTPGVVLAEKEKTKPGLVFP
jgi:nitrate/nitrite transport system ATP-binding protein